MTGEALLAAILDFLGRHTHPPTDASHGATSLVTITRGLTLGKFAPLRRGHQSVIETALTYGGTWSTARLGAFDGAG